MPRRSVYEDEWGEEESDWGSEGDEDEASSEDDEEPTVACPYCRKQIHEDSPRCPYCERYLSKEDSHPPLKPWWVIVGAVLTLYAVVRWIV